MYQPSRFFLVALIALSILLKVLPFAVNIDVDTYYPWGLTLIFAFGLFGVGTFRNLGLAYAGPVGAWLVSDVLIGICASLYYGVPEGKGFSLYPGQAFNYVALVAACSCGLLIRRGRNWKSILAMSVASPAIFFVLSNWGAWYFDFSIGYARTWQGLLLAMEKGLPFFRYSLLSTVTLTVLLFSPLGMAQLQSAKAASLPERARIRA